MKLRHNETGQIFNGEPEFRLAYANVSFPASLDQNALDFANVSVVVETEPPEHTILQRVEYEGVQFIDGVWKEVWSVHPRYDNPTEQAQFEVDLLDAQWASVREERNRLLSVTDYTDLPNTPITDECRAAFVNYRQELRNITNVQTDPYNIIWPPMPEYISNPS